MDIIQISDITTYKYFLTMFVERLQWVKVVVF